MASEFLDPEVTKHPFDVDETLRSMEVPPCNSQYTNDLLPTPQDHRYTPKRSCDCLGRVKTKTLTCWDLHGYLMDTSTVTGNVMADSSISKCNFV